MGLALAPTFPLYLGAATNPLVPNPWPAALAGRTLMLETHPAESALFPPGSNRIESVPLLRQQSDASQRPGEASLNPEGAWRRTVDSWHKGAGQEHYDRVDSNPFRFHESKGVDPWGDWSLTLLKDTNNAYVSAETNLRVTTVNTRLYIIAGDVIGYTDAGGGSGSITITGTPADFVDITTDGTYVYATDGANIWRWAWAANATGAAWSTVDCDRLDFVNGRLMGSHDDTLFHFAADGTKTDVTIGATLPTGWSWVGFAEGPQAIYTAGYSGDRTVVFRIGILDDGTGLDAAVPAAALPDGQTCYAIASYLNFVLIGTESGVRFCSPDPNGNLTVGAKLDTDAPVRCFEGQGTFVWFGWDNFDATSTGLGRLDLREFANTGALAPSYASDLMATGTGAVLSVATFGELRVFTVSGVGVFVEETAELVPEGWVTSGEINYGLVEPKSALSVQVLAERYAGGVAVEISTDVGASWESLGRLSTDTPFNAQGISGRRFDVRLTLTRDESDDEVGPLVSSWTLSANPSVRAARLVWGAFLLHETVETPDGVSRSVDVEFELSNIQGMNETRQAVQYQQGNRTRLVTVEDHEFRLWNFGKSGKEQGTVLVKMREVTL
jgi:hypothetical protein